MFRYTSHKFDCRLNNLCSSCTFLLLLKMILKFSRNWRPPPHLITKRLITRLSTSRVKLLGWVHGVWFVFECNQKIFWWCLISISGPAAFSVSEFLFMPFRHSSGEAAQGMSVIGTFEPVIERRLRMIRQQPTRNRNAALKQSQF